ncbi:MAG: hypothetical protein D6733_04670 [Methanobacteriota archaeon]|nr:MAG: hypothetical protein D6733_04670 [Euryarchaeota archaeon]
MVKLLKEKDGVREEIDYPAGIFENVGRDFPEREQYKSDGILFNSTPVLIGWNGKYFLMDNMYSLIRYDGEEFKVLRYAEGLYSPYRIKNMTPMGRYWVLTYEDTGTPNEVVRILDGEEMEILTDISYNASLGGKILRDKYKQGSGAKFYIDIGVADMPSQTPSGPGPSSAPRGKLLTALLAVLVLFVAIAVYRRRR